MNRFLKWYYTSINTSSDNPFSKRTPITVLIGFAVLGITTFLGRSVVFFIHDTWPHLTWPQFFAGLAAFGFVFLISWAVGAIIMKIFESPVHTKRDGFTYD